MDAEGEAVSDLAGLRVVDGFQAHIVDVCVRKVIPGWRQPDVDLARKVDQLLIALAKVCDHVVDLCRHPKDPSKIALELIQGCPLPCSIQPYLE